MKKWEFRGRVGSHRIIIVLSFWMGFNVLILSLFSSLILGVDSNTCVCNDYNIEVNYCDLCYYANCYGGAGELCSCNLADPDTTSSACTVSCSTDKTSGDNGMAFESLLFGSGNYGFANCCGDDTSEYYTISSGVSNGRGCCDALTDCVAANYGSCYNSWTVIGSLLCDRSDWYACSNYHDKLKEGVSNTACCVDQGSGYAWDLSCSCDEYASVCVDSSCNGDWMQYTAPNGGSSCCEGGEGYNIVEQADCGTLNPTCPEDVRRADCICPLDW